MPHFIVNLPQLVEADNETEAVWTAWAEIEHGHPWIFEVQALDSAFQPIDSPTLVNGDTV